MEEKTNTQTEEARMAKEIQDAQQSADFFDSLTNLLDELYDCADNLEELHVVRRLAKLLEKRDKQIIDDALEQALAILKAENPSRESGAFDHCGKQFEVSARPVFDFVGHPQKYANKEGAEYRSLAADKQSLAEQSSARTRRMANLLKDYPVFHPDAEPDWTELTLRCK